MTMSDEPDHVYIYVREEGHGEDLAFDVEKDDELTEDEYLEEEFNVRPAELTADQKEQLFTALGEEWD
jgi:hypothetical protein